MIYNEVKLSAGKVNSSEYILYFVEFKIQYLLYPSLQGHCLDAPLKFSPSYLSTAIALISLFEQTSPSFVYYFFPLSPKTWSSYFNKINHDLNYFSLLCRYLKSTYVIISRSYYRIPNAKVNILLMFYLEKLFCILCVLPMKLIKFNHCNTHLERLLFWNIFQFSYQIDITVHTT